MATQLPQSDTHDVVIQGPDGSVDFLKFQGTTLVASFSKQYGLDGFRVVASGDFNNDGNPDIVAQNAAGRLDFLFLDAHGNLVASALSNVAVPGVHGAGFFGSNVAGAAPGSPELVSQLPNGQIDILAFNSAGVLVGSDLIAGTIGIPHIVGTVNADGGTFGPGFKAIGTDAFGAPGIGGPDNIVTQLDNGQIDVLGFTGSFGGGTLHYSSSLLLQGTFPTVFAMDQDVGQRTDADLTNRDNGQRTVEAVGVTSSGQIDLGFYDSGYFEGQPLGNGNAGAFEGTNIGTLLENFSLSAGWQIVDAGLVAHNDIFPLV